MPRTPRSPGSKRSYSSRNQRNIGVERLHGQLSAPPKQFTLPPLAPATKARQRQIAQTFDNFVSAPRNIVDKGHRIESLDEWISRDCGFPPPTVIQPFLMFWFAGAKGKKGGQVQSDSVLNFWRDFCSVYRRRSGVTVTPAERQPGHDQCIHMIKTNSLSGPQYKVAQLGKDSISTLQSLVMSSAFVIASWTCRLFILLFINLASQTGSRPSTMLKPSGARTSGMMGARYGCFSLYAERDASGGPNHIHGYYTPSWGKTSWTRGVSYPLPPTPDLRSSTVVILLLCLRLDGGISERDLRNVFDPRFIPPGEKTRKIWIDPSW